MKITKKILSIVMTLVMLCSCLAVAGVAVSADADALRDESYDGNLAITYDQYTRNYSYGTDGASAWPRQVTFNDDGWMRIQSRTAEEIANGERGTYNNQFQYFAYATPMYKTQFKNAIGNVIENDLTYLSIYAYLADVRIINSAGEYAKFAISSETNLKFTFNVRVDSEMDGDLDEFDDVLTLGATEQPFALNSTDGAYVSYRANMSGLLDYVENDFDFELLNVGITLMNFQASNDATGWPTNKDGKKGLGEVDMYVAPVYVESIPGFSAYNANNAKTFDAASAIDPSSFTEGAINPDEWQWTNNEPDNDPLTVFKLGDIRRDANKCPITASGTAYNPEPVGHRVVEPEVVCSNLKATVSGSTVKLTWSHSGGTAKSFFVHESTGKYSKTVTTNSLTLTLPNGSYQFRVKGTNSSGKQGKYTAYTTVKVAVVKVTVPKVATTKKVTAKSAAKKKLNVTWKKVSGANGYEVQVALKKTFKGAKTVKIGKGATVKTTVKSLKSGKKYFVRVRAYKNYKNAAGKTVKAYGAYKKLTKAVKVK